MEKIKKIIKLLILSLSEYIKVSDLKKGNIRIIKTSFDDISYYLKKL